MVRLDELFIGRFNRYKLGGQRGLWGMTSGKGSLENASIRRWAENHEATPGTPKPQRSRCVSFAAPEAPSMLKRSARSSGGSSASDKWSLRSSLGLSRSSLSSRSSRSSTASEARPSKPSHLEKSTTMVYSASRPSMRRLKSLNTGMRDNLQAMHERMRPSQVARLQQSSHGGATRSTARCSVLRRNPTVRFCIGDDKPGTSGRIASIAPDANPELTRQKEVQKLAVGLHSKWERLLGKFVSGYAAHLSSRRQDHNARLREGESRGRITADALSERHVHTLAPQFDDLMMWAVLAGEHKCAAPLLLAG